MRLGYNIHQSELFIIFVIIDFYQSMSFPNSSDSYLKMQLAFGYGSSSYEVEDKMIRNGGEYSDEVFETEDDNDHYRDVYNAIIDRY